ncbi:hypothetical protein TVAG_315840 [Trichomonas vaginalis G3]|uniref:Interferon-related developmental regulator N-terminal domain-containing protein n=1 Tax=Trichomonas vaginalis (strain ATCC PRA-98 / G3) TaxID=412133 RepID=A2FLP3_TRIV3|nr:Interferon-related developmental regulator (IFRD) family [Trichomonas vaginalis G3]EAX94178.1 hypothetical protein TVAG_315840 [Trichomonas vaginalis G3]KAI5540678.1 Interferon-related developmental regulator (IFRD) family [Trichomonas vaginalis G3]|eukprot:XP_001307108.1 hypothetical protein [Trichomonas vaginalis G3]
MAPKRKGKKQNYEDHEEEAYEEPRTELDNWRVNLPNLVERLAETTDMERINTIRSITDILTARSVGGELRTYVDDLMLNLHDPIFYSEDKTESVEALICICTVCLHLYGYFEPAAMAFINELIPTFDQLQEINENPFRAFAIGYICILTVRNTEYTTKVLDKLFSFFTNDKLYKNLNDELIAESITAINLLLPCFATSTVTDVFYENIKKVLDKGFDSGDGPTVLATLDLYGLTYEYLFERQFVNDKGEELDEPKPEAEEILNAYINDYRIPLRQAASGIDNKDNQKLVREKTKQIQGLLDGEDYTTKISVNIQMAEVPGMKKNVFLNATKRIARFHFEQLLIVNRGVQHMLGVSFLDASQAQTLKMNMREGINAEREENEKIRSLEVQKKRKLKEKRLNTPEDEQY